MVSHRETQDGLNDGSIAIVSPPGCAYCIAKAPRYATDKVWKHKLFFQRMKIYVHDQVYRRVKDVAKCQGRTKSDLVQDALVRFLGMEGMPLDDEVVYGRDDGKENKE